MTPKRYRESEPEQRTMGVAAISHHVAVITRYDICYTPCRPPPRPFANDGCDVGFLETGFGVPEIH